MRRNAGFSLIELMVAMVVGVVIILGAGQLFLTVFETNRQVDVLSEKQAAVNFAVEALLRDVRRAKDWSPTGCCESAGELVIQVPNRGDMPSCSEDHVEKTYRLSDQTVAVGGENVHLLELEAECVGGGSSVTNELVAGFAEDGVDAEPVGDYGAVITLDLRMSGGGSESLEFFAVNRTAAVGGDDDGAPGGEGSGGGGDDNGDGSEGGDGDADIPVCDGPPWGAGGKPDECK